MKTFTFRIVLSIIFASTIVLTGCDKRSEELLPAIELAQGLVYHFPFDGNSINVVNNENYEIHNAFYSTDRFGEADKALSLGCKCGLSYGGLRNVDLGLGTTEGATSIWLNMNELNTIQPIFFKGYNADAHPFDYSIFAFPNGSLQFFWTGLNPDDESVIVPDVFTAEQWQHLLIRWSQNTGVIELFTNGKKVMSKPYQEGPGMSDVPLFVGFNPIRGGDDEYYRGKMDDFRVYDRWLNDSEVVALAK